MALQAYGISDLLKTTLENVERLKFTDLSAPLQRYIAMSRMMKKKKSVFESGVDFQWDLMGDSGMDAAFVPLYAEDIITTEDVMLRGKIPWRHISWNWSIERREIAMNRAPLKIVDMAMTRRFKKFIGAIRVFEQKFWRCPAVGDEVSPYGVPYYVVKNATEGFYGGLPSGYADVAGVVPSNPLLLNADGTSRWANYTFQYQFASRDDLIRKWRAAAEKTDFDTPMPNMPTTADGDDMMFFTNYNLRSRLVEILQTNNDNLGNELAAYENDVRFMGSPVEWVPQLDEDTTDPIYGIQFAEFGTAGLRGEWLHETQRPIGSRQHTVATNFTDCSFNWWCSNRRRQFVGATGTTMPA